MFTRVEVRNFRSLKDVSVPLSNFHVLVGPNGSGKTTFLDVFVFMRDLLGSDGISGALRKREVKWEDLLFHGRSEFSLEFVFEASIPESILTDSPLYKFDSIRYGLILHKLSNSKEVRVVEEMCHLFQSSISRANLSWRPVVDNLADADFFRKILPESEVFQIVHRQGERCDTIANDSLKKHTYTFSNGSLALEKIPEDLNQFPVVTWLKRQFSENIQPIVLDSEAINQAGKESAQGIVNPDGSNLPWLIDSLYKKYPDRYELWLRHVKVALPSISSIETVLIDYQEEMFLKIKYKEGNEVNSKMVSDGTLRLLLLTIIPYHLDLNGLFLIEEPEIGIHPQAIDLIMQSLRSVYEGQVLVTTHSSDVVNSVEKKDLLFFTKNDKGETEIISGNDHPRLENWNHAVSLGELFGSGVFGS